MHFPVTSDHLINKKVYYAWVKETPLTRVLKNRILLQHCSTQQEIVVLDTFFLDVLNTFFIFKFCYSVRGSQVSNAHFIRLHFATFTKHTWLFKPITAYQLAIALGLTALAFPPTCIHLSWNQFQLESNSVDLKGIQGRMNNQYSWTCHDIFNCCPLRLIKKEHANFLESV